MSKQKVLIIGAGSTGLSTALEIARSSSAEIIVLEKDYAGAGQTGQCCGFVRHFYNVPEMIISAAYSSKKILKICQANPEIKYTKMGLLVIDNLGNQQIIKENIKLLKSLGVQAKFLNSGQIRTINPYLLTDLACAGYDEEVGYINPHLVVGYLKKKCLDAGVKICEQAAVLGIKRIERGFKVFTSNECFYADKVFNATAGYSNNINKLLGFGLPIKTIRINNTFYRLPLGPQGNLTAIADFENGFYVIPHEDFIDVSSMVLDLQQEIDPCKEEASFDHKAIEINKQFISKRIKGAETSAILGGFGSHIDVTPDYYPILGQINEVPNYYCAAGFSGTGFKHFPMVSKIMSEIILEQDYTYPNLVQFFRYDRFKNNTNRGNVRDSYFIRE